MSTFDHERAAEILIDAAYEGDQAAAMKWSVSPRTIRNYRHRMGKDTKLASLFRSKRERMEQDWAAELPSVIRSATGFIRRAAERGDPTDPDMVHAVAGGMKLVAEVHFAKQMLDARMRVLDVRNSGEPGTDRTQIAAVVAVDGEYTVG